MEQNEIGHWNDIVEKFKLWGIFPDHYPTKSEIEEENLLVGGDCLENEYPKFEDIRVDDRPTIQNSWLDPGLMILTYGGAGIQITDKGRGLLEFPDVIDGEQFTILNGGFYRAKFKKMPKMNTANVTGFLRFLAESSNLEEMEPLDTSSGTSFEAMVSGCPKLTSFPFIDTSKGTNFLGMFDDCGTLTTVPLLDTSKGKNFRAFWGRCTLLKAIPKLDLSSGDNFFHMFSRCSSVTEIPALNTINGTNFFQMFRECKNLVTIESIDLQNGTDLSDMFIDCSSLVNVKVKNLKENLSFTTSPLLSQESIEYLIDNLQVANGKKISLHADTLPKVTEEYRQKALSKGFTIA